MGAIHIVSIVLLVAVFVLLRVLYAQSRVVLASPDETERTTGPP